MKKHFRKLSPSTLVTTTLLFLSMAVICLMQVDLVSGLSSSTPITTAVSSTRNDGSTNQVGSTTRSSTFDNKDTPVVEYSQRISTFPNSISLNHDKDESSIIDDRKVFQRQTGQINPSKAAIGKPLKCKCKYGFPQVFVMDPMYNNRINSGLLKLTCPLLVNAIDKLEDNGLINTINQRIQNIHVAVHDSACAAQRGIRTTSPGMALQTSRSLPLTPHVLVPHPIPTCHEKL